MHPHAPFRRFVSLPAPARQPVRALLVAAAFVVSASQAHAQGCVAIKQMGDGACTLGGLDAVVPDRWEVDESYEHFRSHRHFIGTQEQHQRYTAGSEVVNVVEQFDTAIVYKWSARYSFALDLPYFSASRSSLYEHDGVHRHTMRARGLGDIRVSGRAWLRNPATQPANNLALGLGLKMPTGNTNAKDIAYTKAGPVLRTVDQSIQPGDGGWGVAVDLQAYQRLAKATTLYATGFYLINPSETNGTNRSSNLASLTAFDSVPDQYQVRIGLSQAVPSRYHFTASLGGRLEGVPALDLIGGSKGFRRPGYVVSIEPGVAFGGARDSFSLAVPWAILRDRTRSYADMQTGKHGDAAFADFLISLTYAHKW
jgi:hypothetical protein